MAHALRTWTINHRPEKLGPLLTVQTSLRKRYKVKSECWNFPQNKLSTRNNKFIYKF